MRKPLSFACSSTQYTQSPRYTGMWVALSVRTHSDGTGVKAIKTGVEVAGPGVKVGSVPTRGVSDGDKVEVAVKEMTNMGVCEEVGTGVSVEAIVRSAGVMRSGWLPPFGAGRFVTHPPNTTINTRIMPNTRAERALRKNRFRMKFSPSSKLMVRSFQKVFLSSGQNHVPPVTLLGKQGLPDPMAKHLEDDGLYTPAIPTNVPLLEQPGHPQGFATLWF